MSLRMQSEVSIISYITRSSYIYSYNRTQLHVYRCTKKSHHFAEFCFFCNEWLYDFDAWEQHCHSHLSLDHLPVEVAYERVESTFLPGYCPYCLWDTSLSAASRLRQFCTKSKWEAEVRDHGLRWRRQHCPDERCAEEFKNGDSFVCHMHDLHRVPEELLIATARGLKRKADMVEDIRQPKIKIRNAWDDATSVFDTWSFEEAT